MSDASIALRLHGSRWYILGICGIGMSGIALLMHNSGYIVSGFDAACGPELLANLGIKVSNRHDRESLVAADFVVRSSAFGDDHPEVIAARTIGKVVFTRAQVLSALVENGRNVCVAGAHGKTTATTLLGGILNGARDARVICGGIMVNHNTNVVFGKGDWSVIEADESDRTCVELSHEVGLITNVRDEHSSILGGYEAIKGLFREFVECSTWFNVLCADDQYCRELAILPNSITYGIDHDADFLARNIEYSNGKMNFDVLKDGEFVSHCAINLIGKHNVLNALGAFATAYSMGVGTKDIVSGLASCLGVLRRFENIGKINDICFYDDYAHHPEEIEATIKMARYVAGNNKLITVVQPHRYSRLADYLDNYATVLSIADEVSLMDVYGAGEKAEDFGNISSQDLLKLVKKAKYVTDVPSIRDFISKTARAGDVVVFMGAGNITKVAREVVCMPF